VDGFVKGYFIGYSVKFLVDESMICFAHEAGLADWERGIVY